MSGFDGAYAGQAVLVTGETGFKGAWLAWWLHELGARVVGLSLPPPTTPSLHEQSRLDRAVPHLEIDVRDAEALPEALERTRPRVIFHLAARSLVREAYADPLAALATNVMGTVHLVEAVRRRGEPCAVLVVTSDKCYRDPGEERARREDDALGGRDPYSASKACAELVAASFRSSFFPPELLNAHGVALATARAGNVLGPGDWACDRIVPDCVRALAEARPVPVRNPAAVRPWQHVLDPLAGYLWLGARLLSPGAARWCSAWNFGPRPESWQPVRSVVERVIAAWGEGRWEDASEPSAPPESPSLRLDATRAEKELGWRPVWGFEETLERTARGYRRLQQADAEETRALVRAEIAAHGEAARAAGLPWVGATPG